MRAGQLDRRITIERVTTARDEYGDPIETWTDLITIDAEKREPRGREFFAAGTVAEVNTVFVCRHMDVPSLTTQDRISYDGKDYDIVFVGEIGRREAWEIMAKWVERRAD